MNIYELGELSITQGRASSSRTLELSERDQMIAERVVKEVNERLRFLLDVGPRLPHAQPLVGHAGRR